MLRILPKTFTSKFIQLSQRRFKSYEPLFGYSNLHREVYALKAASTNTDVTLNLIVAQLAEQQAENNARFAELLAEMKTLRVEIADVKNITTKTSGQVASLRHSISTDFEILCAAWIRSWLALNGHREIPYNAFKLRSHFVDFEGIFDPSLKGIGVDLELDIFCQRPLVAAELTWTLASGLVHEVPEKAIEKANKFGKKLDFLEKKFGRRPRAFFVCSAEVDRDLLIVLKELLGRHKVHLVYFDGDRRQFNKVEF